jgi:hypothetical protein
MALLSKYTPWVLILSLVAGAYHIHNERIRAQGRAEVFASQVQGLLSTVDSLTQAQAEADSIAEENISRLELTVDSLQGGETRRESSTDSTIVLIREVVPPEMESLVDSLEAEIYEERVAWDTERGALYDIIAEKDAQLEARDARFQAAEAALKAQIQALQAQPSHGWQERLVDFAAGLAIGYVGSRVAS